MVIIKYCITLTYNINTKILVQLLVLPAKFSKQKNNYVFI